MVGSERESHKVEQAVRTAVSPGTAEPGTLDAYLKGFV